MDSPITKDRQTGFEILAPVCSQKLEIKIKKAVLVAGFVTPLGKGPEPMLKKSYDWEKLGGTLVLCHGEGHMGSEKFKQPYKEFPLLLKLIL